MAATPPGSASDLCTPTFTELAAQLGGIPCEGAHKVVYLNDPFGLRDWTMPVVELVMIGGAVLALVHAIRTLRRTGSAVNLGVWVAAVVYVVLLEPPLYFPEAFGIDGYVSTVFVHNVFTVGFVYERMPLYILCLYPALVYLAWVIVDELGIRVRHPGLKGALLTAVCLGFVHHSIYEIFDHLGPQRLWWAWDFSAPTNAVTLGSVPITSMVNFALVMPAAFALLALVVLERRERPTVRSVLLPALGVGALTPLVSAPGQAPGSLLEVVDETVIAVVLYLMIVAAGLLTAREVWARWHDRRASPAGRYPLAYLAAYLASFLVLWAVALPQTLAADNGLTSDGRPVGSLWYVAACFVVTAAIVSPLLRDARAFSPRAASPPRAPAARLSRSG
jgi:hypothetical protein